MLHGVDIQPSSSRFSKSIGHQHVLEPELRTKEGAHNFAQHLLTKAAERLRHGDYYCRRLGLHLAWIADLGGWWDETTFLETRDTGFLHTRLKQLWQRVPAYKPLSVGVVLLDLVPADQHQPDLFTADNHRRQKLSSAKKSCCCFSGSARGSDPHDRGIPLHQPCLRQKVCARVHRRWCRGFACKR
jgi:DNA polymerase-4